MKYKNLEIQKKEKICYVELNRPGSLNALNSELLIDITNFSNSLSKDLVTRVVIFTGKGKSFSAGADLKEKVEHSSKLEAWRSNIGKPAIKSILDIPQITIAAVNGYCLGGAACIVSACDFRIGASDSKVGYPEINLAINLNWLGLPLAVSLVGPAKAKRLVIGGKNESAQDLLEWGFYDQICEKEELMNVAKEMANLYVLKPPMAAQMIKKSVNVLSLAGAEAIMHMDYDQTLLTAETRDRSEAIKAFFSGEKPEFKGD